MCHYHICLAAMIYDKALKVRKTLNRIEHTKMRQPLQSSASFRCVVSKDDDDGHCQNGRLLGLFKLFKPNIDLCLYG